MPASIRAGIISVELVDRVGNTLVLGLGNPLRGDDGAGPAVVGMLREKAPASEVTFVDGGVPGLEMILIWEGYQKVIIVDAADMGLQPGQWRRFFLDEAELPGNPGRFNGSLHTVGLAEALELAEALDMLPPHLVFYGIQPQGMGWQSELSLVVQPAVSAVCEAVLVEINGLSELLMAASPDAY